MNAGVPQGEMQTRPLFLMHINDCLSCPPNPIDTYDIAPYILPANLQTSYLFNPSWITSTKLRKSVSQDLGRFSNGGNQIYKVKFNASNTQSYSLSHNWLPSTLI